MKWVAYFKKQTTPDRVLAKLNKRKREKVQINKIQDEIGGEFQDVS
jgi:hypothetical protein